MTTFTAAEQATIAHAVEDHAASWYGQVGLFTFGRDEAARYTAEGPLGALCDRHGLKAVWRAVAAHIDTDPQVLEHRLTAEQLAERRAARAQAAREIAGRAAVAFADGDTERALELLEQAQQADPTHRPGGRSFEQVREIIAAGLPAGKQ